MAVNIQSEPTQTYLIERAHTIEKAWGTSRKNYCNIDQSLLRVG